MKSLKYIGEVTKKSGNFSIFRDDKGDEKKIFGGVVGDVVIYSEARDLLFLVEKKLWQLLSTLQKENITTTPNNGASSGDVSGLQAEIQRLNAVIQALQTSDNQEVIEEMKKLQEILDQKEKELATLREQVDELAQKKEELANSTNRLNELNAQIQRLNEELKAKTNEVEAVVL